MTDDRRIDRRGFIVRAGAVAGVAWATPVVASLPATAQGQPSPRTDPCAAEALFTDSFNNETGSNQLNYTGLVNWTVTQGTVDIIVQPNPWGLVSPSGNPGDKFLDMDGSRSDDGEIESKQVFTLEACSHELSVDLSGNQRNTGSDTIEVYFAGVLLASISKKGDAPWLTHTFAIAGPQTGKIAFKHVGSADNVGILLDNVVLRRVGP